MEKLGTVLIVDDDKNIVALLNTILEPNYNILSANNGAEALLILESNAVDLALLDVNMPIMKGYELCEKIKQNPATADVSILFVTGMGSIDNIVSGFKAGASDYITKPFIVEELLARVQNQVDLRTERKNYRFAILSFSSSIMRYLRRPEILTLNLNIF